jgi:hypothetical protein
MAAKDRSTDELNLSELGTVCPVADKQLLCSPSETKGWVTLKEGYLLKTKVKKLHKSTKLRLFVLKQDPNTLKSRLEYYEGKSFRGAAVLENAKIHPELSGVFLVHTIGRTFILQAEKGDLKVAMSWVLALQQAIHSATAPSLKAKAQAAAAPSTSTGSLHPPSQSVPTCFSSSYFIFVLLNPLHL